MPTFMNVVHSLMLESPTITWSRRNRSASACGSSRVLMIGRERVVALRDALPDVLGALGDAVLRAARPVQDLACAAVDLPGHEERDQHVGHARELAVAGDQVVLVAAVGVAGRVGVVLEQVDLSARCPPRAAASRRRRAAPPGSAPPPCRARPARGRRRTPAWRTRDGSRRPGTAGRRSPGTRSRSGPSARPGGTGSGRPRPGDRRRWPRNVQVTPYSFSSPKIRRSIQTAYAVVARAGTTSARRRGSRATSSSSSRRNFRRCVRVRSRTPASIVSEAIVRCSGASEHLHRRLHRRRRGPSPPAYCCFRVSVRSSACPPIATKPARR